MCTWDLRFSFIFGKFQLIQSLISLESLLKVLFALDIHQQISFNIVSHAQRKETYHVKSKWKMSIFIIFLIQNYKN